MESTRSHAAPGAFPGALFLGAALVLAAAALPPQPNSKTSLSQNFDQTTGGWWSNGITQLAIPAQSGSQARPFCSLAFYLRARTTTSLVINIALYDAGGPWATSPKRIASTTMKVGTVTGTYTAYFEPPALVPPNQTFHIVLDNTTRIMFPVSYSGTATPFRSYLNNAWQPGTQALPWNFRLGCGTAVKAGSSTYGCGCGAPLPLTMAYQGEPILGRTDFFAEIYYATPKLTGVLSLGFSDRRWGSFTLPLQIPMAQGCPILASMELLQGVTTDSYGKGTVRLPIPRYPALLGVRLYNQFLFPHAGTNALGLLVSDGGVFKIGDC